MARKLIQDIYVKEKPADVVPVRQHEEIQRPAEPRQEPKMPPTKAEKEFFNRRQDFKKIFRERKKDLDVVERFGPEEKISKNSHIFIWIVCIICVATLLFFVSSIFATATLTITPKYEPVALNDTYQVTMSTSTAPNASTTPSLNYQIVAMTQTMSESLVTSGSQNVAIKAAGKAVIYNNYSAASQRLIINTRLETTGGLIYRITQSTTVPGIKTINGVKTPGSVEVNIIADAPGTQYNMKLTDFKGDFTVPGFQGTPQYNGFYARFRLMQ